MLLRYLQLKLVVLLVVVGLVLSLPASVFAQSEEDDADPARVQSTEIDSSFWEESVGEEVEVPKPEQDVVMPVDDKDNITTGNQNSIYIPMILTPGNGLVNGTNTPRPTAIPSIPTFTILQEGFEGIWPAGKWKVKNTTGGTVVWDDVNVMPHSGNWSAQPADGIVYPNNLSTYMQYGPFSLPSADVSSATFSFYYYLNSESGHDFFTWGYSCNNGVSWVQTTTSGLNGWSYRAVSLTPCQGKSTILIRFTFTSDSSTKCGLFCPPGVFVDDVLIQYKMIG